MGYMMRKLTGEEFARYVQILHWAEKKDLLYAAVAAICIGVGARIGEVLRLRLRDIVNPDGTAKDEIVRCVEKKRRIDFLRCAFPVEIFGEIIERHAARQILTHGLFFEDYAFCRRKSGRPVTYLSAWLHNRAFLKAAGVPVSGVAFHGLRKTFLTEYFLQIYKKTNDMFLAISATQKVAGHEDFGTTARYISTAIAPSTQEVQQGIWEKIKENLERY